MDSIATASVAFYSIADHGAHSRPFVNTRPIRRKADAANGPPGPLYVLEIPPVGKKAELKVRVYVV
jgi:hypothetical protein